MKLLKKVPRDKRGILFLEKKKKYQSLNSSSSESIVLLKLTKQRKLASRISVSRYHSKYSARGAKKAVAKACL